MFADMGKASGAGGGGSDGPCWEASGTPSPSHEPDARGSLGQADAAQECPFLRDQDLRALLPLVRVAPQWQNHGEGSRCGGGRCRVGGGHGAQGPKAGLGGAAPGLGGERRFLGWGVRGAVSLGLLGGLEGQGA